LRIPRSAKRTSWSRFMASPGVNDSYFDRCAACLVSKHGRLGDHGSPEIMGVHHNGADGDLDDVPGSPVTCHRSQCQECSRSNLSGICPVCTPGHPPPRHVTFVENKGRTPIRPNGDRPVEVSFCPYFGPQSRLFPPWPFVDC
jgi:hypothetical protein